MKLHRLEIAAFGPFRGRQVVDFDELSAAGVFLLHGSTGAGKTSVLDAVCYALYGRAPGTRSGITALRSHYAEADERPEIVLDFSVGPRRFEVTRSPSWERPKRRGDGTTTAPARVALRELVDGTWSTLSTRIDEAAHQLDEVLGMGGEAFTKLVMLPQGEFAAFLRADAETRRALLERIFGTDRFAAVQEWLRRRRTELRASVDAVDATTLRLLAQAEQAAGPALRTQASEEREQSVEQAPARISQLLATVGQAREAALTDQLNAVQSADHAGVIHDQAQAMAQLAQQFTVLVDRQQAAERRQGEIDRARERIDRARRAEPLTGLMPALAAARARRGEAAAGARAAVEALGPLDGETDWAPARDRATAALSALAALQPVAEEYERLTGRHRHLRGDLEEAERHTAEARRRLTTAEAAVETARRLEASVRERAAGVDGDRWARDAARRRAEAARERDRLAGDLAVVGADHERAREAAVTAREHYLDVRERRLAGLAAALAATLVDGTPCRVCGSAEHPDPARQAPDQVDAVQERLAHDEAEGARERASELASRRAALAAELAGATERAEGLAAEAAAAALQLARERLAETEAAAARAPQCAEDLAEAGQRLEVARRESDRHADRVQDLQRQAEAVAVRLRGLDERLVEARGEHPDLATRRATLAARQTALVTAIAARQEHEAAEAHLAEVGRAAEAAATAAGFADADQALAAVLEPAAVARLERQTIEHRVELESVEEQLTDVRFTVLHEGPAAVLDAEALKALAGDLQQTKLREQEAVKRAGICDHAYGDLERLAARLATHLAAGTPVRERFATLDDLTRCAEGTGGDNALRMSLSAFVLAARLEQVAAAATERLAQMSSGRYALVHTDTTERGRGRAGLTLEVVDAWTGARRATDTLSGGEAFYTSLALALGLADVVAEEAGGVHLDTLFIDEGFGSLDEDTLDEVMDTLDGLRSGGRAVGVVSHLAELRQRIGTRLEVTKSARGSTLTLAS